MSAKALVGTRCARPPSLTVLALAEETRAAARDAIARAQDAVLNMMEIRLAWARVRQRGNDPSPTYHNIHLGQLP